jgi:predicted Rossmann-fold nucleotide-binding protein
MVIAEDLAERKALLLARSDAIVVMAGGLGTLDEATDILEQRKHGLHDKPVVLLNTAGFYDGLTLQLQRMEDEGFLPVPLADLVFVTDGGAGALAYLEKSLAR